MTFLYTGCSCGRWYTIDYSKSNFPPFDADGLRTAGRSDLVYECWEPGWLHDNDTVGILPPEFVCEDLANSSSTNPLVHWVVTDLLDATTIISSGVVSVGEEYTVSSAEFPILPEWINLTFYELDGNDRRVLQTNVFPTSVCVGTHDPRYSRGWPHTHIVEVQDLYGVSDLRHTVKNESYYVNITVNASSSNVNVRLDELSMISNISPTAINMTGAVHGVVLAGGHGHVTTHAGTSISVQKRRSFSLSTMELVMGPLTVDLYWRTRYTVFGTVTASDANDPSRQCNGYDFGENIFGMG
jgi:hypothetical protein